MYIVTSELETALVVFFICLLYLLVHIILVNIKACISYVVQGKKILYEKSLQSYNLDNNLIASKISSSEKTQ